MKETGGTGGYGPKTGLATYEIQEICEPEKWSRSSRSSRFFHESHTTSNHRTAFHAPESALSQADAKGLLLLRSLTILLTPPDVAHTYNSLALTVASRSPMQHSTRKSASVSISAMKRLPSHLALLAYEALPRILHRFVRKALEDNGLSMGDKLSRSDAFPAHHVDLIQVTNTNVVAFSL